MSDDKKTPPPPPPPQPTRDKRFDEGHREIDAGKVIKVERPEAWPPPPAKKDD